MGRRSRATKPPSAIAQSERELADLVDKLLRVSATPHPPTVQKSLDSHRELATLAARVRKLEKKRRPAEAAAPRAGGAPLARLLAWARAHGAELRGCSVAAFPGYDLGLRADADVARASLVVAVPRRLMMSVESAGESALGALIRRDQILASMPNVTLALFLLMERYKGDSFWAPYIDILPASYTTVLYFTVEELEELRGSPSLEVALKQIKSITRQYAYFYKLFHTADDPISGLMRKHFTYADYCWAVSTVMTRQNTIPVGTQDYYALIPLWDLCNHTNGTVSTGYNPVLDRSECLALRDFKAGEQLFIFYGSRNNSDLLIHNGFVYEDNEHDLLWIRLGVSKSDSLLNKRQKLLEKLQLSATGGEFCLRKVPEPLNGELLAFIRVFNMNEAQLDHWLQSEKSSDLQYVQCALDTELEKKSWGFLKNRLQLCLGCYRTTLAEDEILIKEVPVSNRLLAIRLRATEKRIISDTLEYVEQYIKQ